LNIVHAQCLLVHVDADIPLPAILLEQDLLELYGIWKFVASMKLG